MNGLRSLLTLLGIFVGVAAVITAVTITQGTSGLITQRLAGLGTNVLYITPGSGTGGAFTRAGAGSQTLKQSDANAIQGVSHVTAVTPIISGSHSIIFGVQNETAPVQGVYPSYTTISSWNLAQGAMFTNDDETVRFFGRRHRPVRRGGALHAEWDQSVRAVDPDPGAGVPRGWRAAIQGHTGAGRPG